MPYTNNWCETPFPDQISRQTGRHEDNVFKATKTSNHSAKGSDKCLLIPPLHQDHGIINWFQWILIKPGHQEEIGEEEDEVCREGT